MGTEIETDNKAKTGRRQWEAGRGGWRWTVDRKISGLFKCCPALVQPQSGCQGAALGATPAQWAFVSAVLRGAQGRSSWPALSQVFSCQGADNQAQWGRVDAGEFWALFFFFPPLFLLSKIATRIYLIPFCRTHWAEATDHCSSILTANRAPFF